jgi:hypothetical protein
VSVVADTIETSPRKGTTMSERPTECDICDKDIDMSHTDGHREDDSGIYHEECLEKYWAKEASIALAEYQQHERNNPPIDYSDAYEWGDPNNPAYIEWLIEQADAERG